MTIRILVGDVRERLRDLPDGSIQCVVTSPPYFGLRDYGTASWDGGEPACDHKPDVRPRSERANPSGSRIGHGGTYSDQQDLGVNAFRDQCRKCGAVRVDNQIGLEPTLAEYIATLVEVFRDVRRVLRDDGTVWLNLGDSYAGSTQGGGPRTYVDGGKQRLEEQRKSQGHLKTGIPAGLKPKDLMMVPARVAIALQDDGWYLRSDIIWAKKNCMPESVTDRPTSSHEHIFLLTKHSRYFYDAEAVREALEPSTVVRDKSPRGRKQNGGGSWESMNGIAHTLELGDMASNPAGRNQRNVWHLATEPFPDAHFATFPTEIPRRCIAAGTSERGQCAACGAPWVRVVERTTTVFRPSQRQIDKRAMDVGSTRTALHGTMLEPATSKTTGWRPSCSCNADVVPQTVLDPFLGSGTTLLVADRLGRNGIGVELSPDYAAMAEDRIRGDAPMFADVAAD